MYMVGMPVYSVYFYLFLLFISVYAIYRGVHVSIVLYI